MPVHARTVRPTRDSPAELVSPAQRLLDHWVPLAVLALLPGLLLATPGRQVGDPDAFWHIRAGHYVLDTWRFTGPDPWTLGSSNPWVLHEWLAEAAMALADSAAGLAGVAWLWHAAMLGVVVAVFFACRSHGTLLQTTVGTVAAWFGASAGLGARPQLVSFALVAVTVGAWLRTREDLKPRWWLIPMTWLWASAHGMWFIGPLVGLVVTAGLVADGRPRRALTRLAVVPVLSLAVAALTPVGPKLLWAPLAVSDYTKYIVEWAPSALTSPTYLATLGMLLLTMALWLRHSARVAWTLLALWLLALGWTLLYARTVAIGAVIAAPLLVGALHGHFGGDRAGAGAWGRREAVTLLGSIGTVLVTAALVLPMTSSRPAAVPSGLDPQLDALPAKTVVFNEYELGGWLLWRHPQLMPVIDGRTEIFSVPYLDAYVSALAARPGWQATIRKTGATAAILPALSPVADALVHQERWTVLAQRDGYLLLTAATT